jgi:hypothetical protein
MNKNRILLTGKIINQNYWQTAILGDSNGLFKFSCIIFTCFKNQIIEISALNVKQNDLVSKRNRLTKQNIEMFNDLWESLQPVLKTAKAIYRGVDDVKLKDYTIAQLLKRINATRKKEKE